MVKIWEKLMFFFGQQMAKKLLLFLILVQL